MSYKINFSTLGQSFSLPRVIAENYIKMANEAQIKTILWIFSHTEKEINPAEIAKKIGKTVPAVEEALLYWTSVGVLLSEAVNDTVTAVGNNTGVKNKEKVLPDIPEFAPSYEQVVKRCDESPELKSFFSDIQKILGKTMGYEGESVFLMMHDSYGLPFEVIFMLVDYCTKTGKISYKYMSKMAKSWGEKEIDTIEKADKAIKDMDSCQKVWEKLMRFSGIETPKPTSSQTRYLLKWINDYKFTAEMICCAYEIMADNSPKISFAYMNAVLTSWFEKGISTPETAEKSGAEYKQATGSKRVKSAKAYTSASYDIDELEKRADELPVYVSPKGENK